MNPNSPGGKQPGFTRRRWLQVGALGLTGVTLNTLAANPRTVVGTAPNSFGRAKRCVMLFLTGGAPQNDTFDPKPLAPENVRGELLPIATSVPGVHVTELFPQFARRVNRVTLLRSVTHDDAVHTSAGYTMLTGRRHSQANAKTAADIKPLPTDHPHVGSIVSLVRPDRGAPTFVSLPEIIKDAAVNEFPGLNGGLMGERYSPLLVEGSPQTGRFTPPPVALAEGSPKINAQAGRDHWPQAATVVLAGAGVQSGAVYGATDRLGAYPSEHPVSPADLTATLLHLLGVSPNLELHDKTGRPHRACEGSPVLELLG